MYIYTYTYIYTYVYIYIYIRVYICVCVRVCMANLGSISSVVSLFQSQFQQCSNLFNFNKHFVIRFYWLAKKPKRDLHI